MDGSLVHAPELSCRNEFGMVDSSVIKCILSSRDPSDSEESTMDNQNNGSEFETLPNRIVMKFVCPSIGLVVKEKGSFRVFNTQSIKSFDDGHHFDRYKRFESYEHHVNKWIS
ncbi:hypothetical protein CEXT_481931 [Caerostris extrusa]|uniref:Ycf2 n=1 Tax=Caerostris extrusa TaxID=172846 RepID=A0AAV4UF08_CAEEX|nr:hypothetical protein CEXT_481931 [Caerostris extrusa]